MKDSVDGIRECPQETVCDEARDLAQWALERMSRPLDDTILPSTGATASGDARCMEIIRNYIADLEAKVRFHDELDRSLSYAHDSLKQRTAIIDRIWDILGRPTYEALEGRTIYDLVTDIRDDARRYRYLRDYCSSHYPMTHEQPAEWSIGWQFQQGTPDERYGSFDSWIDRDIAEREARQAENDHDE